MAAIIAACVLMACAAGCESRSDKAQLRVHPQVTGQDLWADWQSVEPNSYHLLVDGRTQGVFPASIGVLRVRPTPGASGELPLSMKPEVDFLQWNNAFDDLRPVSEVFPIKQIALNGSKPEIDSILAAADALVARLCLIYAEVRRSEHEFEVIGVLFEVEPRRPLATIRSVAVVANPIESNETVTHRDEQSTEKREQRDPRLVSLREFETVMHGCLLALMDNDDPAERVAPEGWVPNRILEPAFWPPVYEWPQDRFQP